MAIGARLILPGIAPERGCANHDARCPCDRRLVAAGLDESRTIISCAKPPKRKILRAELVNSRLEIFERSDNIEIDVIDRAGAGGRAKQHFTARVSSAPGDAGREKQNFRQALACQSSAALR